MATILGFALALVLGLFLALGRRSRLRVVRWPVGLFIEFVRSTPLLVQLYFLYYALPEHRAWSPVPIRPSSSASASTTPRTAPRPTEPASTASPKGQWEASTALNLGSTTKWSRVVLPQAIPNVLPALGNFLVAAFKDAPLGFAIQVTGLMAFATSVGSGDVPARRGVPHDRCRVPRRQPPGRLAGPTTRKAHLL